MSDPKKPVVIEPWQVLESKYSYRDPWLAVRSDTVRVPNGTVLAAAGNPADRGISSWR